MTVFLLAIRRKMNPIKNFST